MSTRLEISGEPVSIVGSLQALALVTATSFSFVISDPSLTFSPFRWT
jgi:hypothetical protein